MYSTTLSKYTCTCVYVHVNILYNYNKSFYNNYMYIHNYNCFITCHCLQWGQTALDLANKRGHENCVKILKEAMVCKII